MTPFDADHFAGLIDVRIATLQARAFPGMPAWPAVERDGRVIGSASSLVILWADYDAHAPWTAITGGRIPDFAERHAVA